MYSRNVFCVQLIENMLKYLEENNNGEEHVRKILQLFPFDGLVNCNITNTYAISLIIKLIRNIVCKKCFFQYPLAVRAFVDFTLTNIVFFTKCTERNDTLPNLLLLLDAILRNEEKISNQIDRDRILEVLFLLMQKSNDALAKILGSRVLCQIMDSNYHNLAMNCAVKTTLLELMDLKAFFEVCLLTETSLRYKILENTSCAIDWIVSNYFYNFEANITSNHMKEMISCLNVIYEVTSRNDVFSKMYQHAHQLTMLCCEESLKEEARKSLTYILKEFYSYEKVPLGEDFKEMTSLITSLPENLNEWVFSENDIFFSIAHLIYLHSKLLWDEKAIINALLHRLSTQKFICIPLLKSMAFLFAVCVNNLDCSELQAAGDTLLKYVQYCGKIESVVTCHETQLSWILKKASQQMKVKFISLWLKMNEDNSILLDVVKRYNGQNILLDIVLKESDQVTCRRVTDVIRNMEDPNTSRRVTCALLQNFHRIDVFGNLILCCPCLPQFYNQGFYLCTVFGAIIPSLSDRTVFRGACLFSCKLLIWLKKLPKAMVDFLKNIANVRVLLKAAAVEDEETALSAIQLLTTLIMFQVRNHLQFDNGVKEDLANLVQGSPRRLQKSLYLIKLIFTRHKTMKLYLSVNDDTLLGLYQKLHEYGHVEETAEFVYPCLTTMIQDNDSLALSAVTAVFIEMNCEFPTSVSYHLRFLLFFKVWLEVISNIGMNCFPRDVIRHYFQRAPPELEAEKHLNSYLLE